MSKLLIFYLGFLLIKVVVAVLPVLTKHLIFKIPRRQYTAEEVIACKHMKPELYYKKQLESKTVAPKEIEIDVIRERFKNKMQHGELTRSQIIAIRRYLESLVSCKEKSFQNDAHAIYYCLKRLKSEGVMNLATLENLLN